MLVGDMGVDLSSSKARMAEHGLNRADVGTVHKKVSCERMTESMRSNVFSNTGEFSVFFDDALDAARS